MLQSALASVLMGDGLACLEFKSEDMRRCQGRRRSGDDKSRNGDEDLIYVAHELTSNMK